MLESIAIFMDYGQIKYLKIKGGIGVAKQMRCVICDYVYDETIGDPENGVAPGTVWENVPEDWVCPLCYVGKDQFEEI